MKWASWTVKKVTHRLHLEAKVTSCGIPAKYYKAPRLHRRPWAKDDMRLVKDKKRRRPTCLMCIDVEAEFGEP